MSHEVKVKGPDQEPKLTKEVAMTPEAFGVFAAAQIAFRSRGFSAPDFSFAIPHTNEGGQTADSLGREIGKGALLLRVEKESFDRRFHAFNAAVQVATGFDGVITRDHEGNTTVDLELATAVIDGFINLATSRR
jgi:hypothetical protein